MTQLTESSYFDQQANSAYLSASQVKRFLECEALALAELEGMHQREETTALLVGGYVDAHFSGTMSAFLEKNPNIYTLKGPLRSDFQQANELISILEEDELLKLMLSGEPQHIITGDIGGVPFKGKIDSLLSAEQCAAIMEQYPDMADTMLMADGAIVDLKVMRDMSPVWVPGAGRLSFLRAWRYDLQLAIYQRLLGRRLPCYLVVITKEKTPDKALIHVPQHMLDAAIEAIDPLFTRYADIKAGRIEPVMCGKCVWCRREKRITGPVDADELEGAEV